MPTTTHSIGTTGRDYSTITLWEADLDDDTPFDAGDDVVGECYNDSAFDEEFTINGGGTLGLNSIKLSVASGERHDGTAGTGARNVTGSTALAVHVKIQSSLATVFEWLEWDANGNGTIDIFDLAATSPFPDISFRNLVVHDSLWPDAFSSQVTSAFQLSLGGKLLNCTIYGIENQKNDANTHYGTQDVSTNNSFVDTVQNTTIHNVEKNNGSGAVYGVHQAHDGTNRVCQNCIVTNTGGSTSGTKQDYFLSAPSNATYDHNLASDTSASGTGSLDSKTAANQFVSTTGGSEDLHLKAGADAIDAGTDLGTTPSGVEIDINGRDRDASGDTWDMGSHELVAAAAAGGVPTGLMLSGMGS